jgi:hypothetical protein
MLGPLARGALFFLAVSIVLCTGVLRSDATRSAAVVSLDDYEEDSGGDSPSFSFTFPETRPRGLVFGFYDETCPDAEEIVSSTVRRLYHADSNVAAALVRLFFHDCFIHVRPNKLAPCRARLPHRAAVFSVTYLRRSRAHTPRCRLLLDAACRAATPRCSWTASAAAGRSGTPARTSRCEASAPSRRSSRRWRRRAPGPSPVRTSWPSPRGTASSWSAGLPTRCSPAAATATGASTTKRRAAGTSRPRTPPTP